MRFDCHTHTRLHSGCSSLRPDELCTLALERGLHGVVITEHRYQWSKAEIASLRDRHPGLGIYSGVELSLREGYDVVCIVGEIPLNLPDFPALIQLENILERHREDIFTFVAHPFRYRDFMTPELEDILSVVEGIEVNSVNIAKGAPQIHEGRYVAENWENYETTRQAYGMVPVFNSDTHATFSVATIANEIDTATLPANEAELAALFRQKDIREWQNTEQLHACLERFMPV